MDFFFPSQKTTIIGIGTVIILKDTKQLRCMGIGWAIYGMK
jgi:hypothetical protein